MHIRSLLGRGLSLKGRQEASVSELGRRGICRKQGSGGCCGGWGTGVGAIDSRELRKVGGGQGMFTGGGGQPRKLPGRHSRCPTSLRDLSKEENRPPASSRLVPRLVLGMGFDCSPFAAPKVPPPVPEEADGGGRRSAVELGGTPCHPSQGDIYRHSWR